MVCAGQDLGHNLLRLRHSPQARESLDDPEGTDDKAGWGPPEIVGAQDGIGAVMMRAGRFLSVDVIMASILTIGLLGVITDLLFRAASRLLFPWNIERRS